MIIHRLHANRTVGRSFALPVQVAIEHPLTSFHFIAFSSLGAWVGEENVASSFAHTEFREEHIETLDGDHDLEEFLKENTEYRPCDERDWGYGGSGPRIRPPAFLVKKTSKDKTP